MSRNKFILLRVLINLILLSNLFWHTYWEKSRNGRIVVRIRLGNKFYPGTRADADLQTSWRTWCHTFRCRKYEHTNISILLWNISKLNSRRELKLICTGPTWEKEVVQCMYVSHVLTKFNGIFIKIRLHISIYLSVKTLLGCIYLSVNPSLRWWLLRRIFFEFSLKFSPFPFRRILLCGCRSLFRAGFYSPKRSSIGFMGSVLYTRTKGWFDLPPLSKKYEAIST